MIKKKKLKHGEFASCILYDFHSGTGLALAWHCPETQQTVLAN